MRRVLMFNWVAAKRGAAAGIAAATAVAIVAGFAVGAFMATATSGAVSALAREWDQYGGGPSRTHEGEGPGGLALYRRWGTVLEGAAHSPAALSGDDVYMGCDDGCVYALDLNTGARRWRFQPENGARIRSGPAVADEVVVAAAANGYVFGIDRQSGAEKWRTRVGLSVTSSVAVAGGRAVVAAYDGRICSLSLADGQTVWDFTIPGDLVSGSPAVGGGLVFVPALGTGEDGGAVYALDEATGEFKWKTPVQGWLGNGVVFSGGKVVVGATGFKTGGVYALDAQLGTVLWGPVRGASNQWSAPAVSAGAVYVGNTGWVYAIDLETGQLRWQWKAPILTRRAGGRTYQHEALVRSPIISGGRVFASTYFEAPGPDAVYVLSAATGRELWKNEIPWRVASGPVGGRGGLIFGGVGGELEAWSPAGLIVNGEPVRFEDVSPIIIEGRTWAPCRALFEAAGFDVTWDGLSRTVSCTRDDVSIVMAVDSPTALVNGREVPLGAPLSIMCDRVMIQPAALVAALGGSIEWDPAKYNVHVRFNEDMKGR